MKTDQEKRGRVLLGSITKDCLLESSCSGVGLLLQSQLRKGDNTEFKVKVSLGGLYQKQKTKTATTKKKQGSK